MSAMQKFAWFNLAVVALSACTVLSLFPVMGMAAHGGFGWLGLLGLSPLFLRKKKGQVIADERDTLIQRRSVILAYTAVWLAFIGGACLCPMFYGLDGAVPVKVIMGFPAYVIVLLFTIMSVSTLIQYRWGLGHEAH